MVDVAKKMGVFIGITLAIGSNTSPFCNYTHYISHSKQNKILVEEFSHIDYRLGNCVIGCQPLNHNPMLPGSWRFKQSFQVSPAYSLSYQHGWVVTSPLFTVSYTWHAHTGSALPSISLCCSLLS